MIHPVSRCQLGDLDLITNEIAREVDERRRIISTLEPIPGGPSFTKTRSENILTLEQSSSEHILTESFTLPIPSAPDGTIAGLYLCKDGEDRGSCADKPVEDFEAIMKSHYIPSRKVDQKTGRILGGIPPRTAQPDRIYFFAPVVLKAGEVVLLDGARSIEELKSSLQGYAGTTGPVGDYIIKSFTDLRSVPLKKDGSIITVELPFNDIKRCQEAAGKG
jgi:hypothetical protein